jgi:hypothetical protein
MSAKLQRNGKALMLRLPQATPAKQRNKIGRQKKCCGYSVQPRDARG